MILCVDPETPQREETEEALRDAGFDTTGVRSVAAARERLDGDAAVEGLVTEQSLPDGTGLELLEYAREYSPDTACVLFTGVPIEAIDTEAFSELVAEYLPKDDPEARSELVSLVEHSLAFRSQTAYPLPEQEDARLAALEQYAADPEALGGSLDRLSELATAMFDVNAAAIGLVDKHEQRFLSCHGVALDSMEREETVCTYAILEDDVTVIEDVGDDPRFAENEGLAAADIRFYASASLVSPEGQPIGTFCVYDDEARTITERDRELLELFADEAMEQLVLRRQRRDTGGLPDA